MIDDGLRERTGLIIRSFLFIIYLLYRRKAAQHKTTKVPRPLCTLGCTLPVSVRMIGILTMDGLRKWSIWPEPSFLALLCPERQNVVLDQFLVLFGGASPRLQKLFNIHFMHFATINYNIIIIITAVAFENPLICINLSAEEFVSFCFVFFADG